MSRNGRTIRILHTADIHFDRENRVPALASLRTFSREAHRTRADLAVIAGDLFNRGVQNSSTSGLPELVSVILDLLDIVPLIVVEGTPTHDLHGCYDVFTSLRGGHSFTVVRKGVPYFLSEGEHGADVFTGSRGAGDRLLILGTGEPSREWFLTGGETENSSRISSTVEAGMKKMFGEAARLRNTYAGLPCVYVYHGLVEGARLPTGTYLHAHEIRPGREDFLGIGADYYALGHVHRAQSIRGIPAWYPGSAYPVSWGETDAKGFQLVDIPADRPGENGERRIVSVRRLRYPHNRRKKLVVRPPAKPGGFAGYQTWVEYRGTKEELASIDPERERLDLLSRGALSGSRVTRAMLPSEAPRAPKIRTARTLREKVEIYALTSGKEFGPGIYEKAALLEREARVPGKAHQEMRLRIRKLVLRGAVGIWKGLRTDQIELDLDAYDGGILSLSGRNGAGKTTLLENLHPFPVMLTRGGPLSSHFRLKDSFRDLTFSDERSGITYRSLILMDPVLSQPKSEFFLLRKEGDDWKSLTNGRLRDYEEAVNGLFGSLRLFLKSAFIPQKASSRNPDLVEAGPFERKALFRELAGLDYLAGYAESSRERSRAYEEKAAVSGAEIPVLEREAARGGEIRTERDALVERRKDLEKVVRGLLERETELSEALEAVRGELETQNIIRSRLLEIELGREKAGAELRSTKDSMTALSGILSEREYLEASAGRYDELSSREKELLEARLGMLERKNILSEAFAKDKRTLQDAEKNLEDEIAEIRLSLLKLENVRGNLEGDLLDLVEEMKKAGMQPDGKCPVCGSELTQETVNAVLLEREQVLHHLHERRERISTELYRYTAEYDRLKVSMEERITGLKDVRDALTTRQERFRHELELLDREMREQELSAVQAELNRLRKENIPERAAAVHDARIGMLELEKAFHALSSSLAELSDEENSLRARLRLETVERHDSVRRELENIRRERTGAQETIAGISALIFSAEKRLQEILSIEERLLDVRKRHADDLGEAGEWALLSFACGPDGIQALELDALSPSIAETANTLLETAYGRRFRIEFRTTREAGKGRNIRQIEDFEIVVHDSLYDSEQPLDTLSGGETVWIRKAIYDSFGIIRSENTGLVFLTNFQDEADGALDPDARIHYLRLLEAAHNESGRHQTIIISHSEEIREAVMQNIEIESLPAGNAAGRPDIVVSGVADDPPAVG